MTFAPASCAAMAAVSPAPPPPTTTISVFTSFAKAEKDTLAANKAPIRYFFMFASLVF